ncbi:hypothetical protein FOE78_19795 [Microlunatus elymi]|uniref:YoaR-like putative peptidoglycan binding domain-containing protein n=1 Tax=Microlunatus elymi TaxID=2596828 RepID=A0A516Q348_9ACTN|nr:VanW family protein [Microlunatus elymi]QDP97849.1 hypothetical protein FOE78_19795 [Microlunatus elymi]
MTGEKSAPPARSRAKVVGLGAGAVVVLAFGLYLIGYLMTGDKTARNASVAGIPIGGMSRTDAVEQLQQALGPRATEPIAVTIDNRSAEVDPADAGVGVDYQATVDRVGIGRSLDPRRIWAGLTGGHEVDPVIATDNAKLKAAVDGLADDHDRKPKDAKIKINDSDQPKINSTKMITGLSLDRAAAARAIPDGLLAEEPVALPVRTSQPQITDDEVAKLIKDRVQPALSGPVTVTADSSQAEITPAMIAKAIEIDQTHGRPTATLNARTLHQKAKSALATFDTKKATDATIKIKNGKPTVVEGKPGTGISADELATAVDAAMTKTGSERTAAVQTTEVEPEFNTADAHKLGVEEVTGEFTTHYPYAEYRNVNIGRAAELINGTLLKPGETFSLNKVVGERTRANGFTEGSIITGGRFKQELGGGVSQSATTTYNAMFFAGLEDIQHQPHTLYIDRYPAGREATVAWPTLDLKFRNNTDYGVLVQAKLKKAEPGGQGSLTVRMWSTKTYDKIESTEPVKSNFTTGRDLTDDSATCVATAPVQGFDVSYSRLFYRDGNQVKKEDFAWTYHPTDRRTCV